MLDERDQHILEFERSWWQHAGAKDHAIRESLGISATRYYQALRRLMDDPAAEKFDPLTVRRLRKVRTEARRRRVERRLQGLTSR